MFAEARRLGVELTVGIELDVALDGREVHLLGLGLDLDAAALGGHLAAVRSARHERARRELALVRERLGEHALAVEDVFVPGRDSLMRPHFIRPLVARGLFATYQDGRDWFHAHARAGVAVPKPAMGAAIGMIHAAGGRAVLAHPGYYWKDGFPILDELGALACARPRRCRAGLPVRLQLAGAVRERGGEQFTAVPARAGEALGSFSLAAATRTARSTSTWSTVRRRRDGATPRGIRLPGPEGATIPSDPLWPHQDCGLRDDGGRRSPLRLRPARPDRGRRGAPLPRGPAGGSRGCAPSRACVSPGRWSFPASRLLSCSS